MEASVAAITSFVPFDVRGQSFRVSEMAIVIPGPVIVGSQAVLWSGFQCGLPGILVRICGLNGAFH